MISANPLRRSADFLVDVIEALVRLLRFSHTKSRHRVQIWGKESGGIGLGGLKMGVSAHVQKGACMKNFIVWKPP